MSTLDKAVHRWANGRDASYANVRISAENGVLYSYRTEIARICDEGVTTLNQTSYSVSTSRHQSLASSYVGYNSVMYEYVHGCTHGIKWKCRSAHFAMGVSTLHGLYVDRSALNETLHANTLELVRGALAVTRPYGGGYSFFLQANMFRSMSVPWLGNVLSIGKGLVGQVSEEPVSAAQLVKAWVPEHLHAARQEGRLFFLEGLLIEKLEPKRGAFKRAKAGRTHVGETALGKPVFALDASVEDPTVFYGSFYSDLGRIVRPDIKWWRVHVSPLHPTF